MNHKSRLQSMADVIEIDDNSSDSYHAPRETRSKSSSTLAARKMKLLREEGGISSFNPDKSIRERKKISKVEQTTHSRRKNLPLYTKTGVFIETGQDLCDCLEENCEGCFYPCLKCGGNKCGQTCRQKRNWYYDNVVIDGQSQSSIKTTLSDLLGDSS